MAKDVTSSVWIFDTAADAEGVANVGVTGVVFDQAPIFVTYIRVDTGNGGNLLVNESNAGKRVLKVDALPSDDTITYNLNRYVRGLYLQTVQTNMSLEIGHGVPTDD